MMKFLKIEQCLVRSKKIFKIRPSNKIEPPIELPSLDIHNGTGRSHAAKNDANDDQLFCNNSHRNNKIVFHEQFFQSRAHSSDLNDMGANLLHKSYSTSHLYTSNKTVSRMYSLRNENTKVSEGKNIRTLSLTDLSSFNEMGACKERHDLTKHPKAASPNTRINKSIGLTKVASCKTINCSSTDVRKVQPVPSSNNSSPQNHNISGRRTKDRTYDDSESSKNPLSQVANKNVHLTLTERPSNTMRQASMQTLSLKELVTSYSDVCPMNTVPTFYNKNTDVLIKRGAKNKNQVSMTYMKPRTLNPRRKVVKNDEELKEVCFWSSNIKEKNTSHGILNRLIPSPVLDERKDYDKSVALENEIHENSNNEAGHCETPTSICSQTKDIDRMHKCTSPQAINTFCALNVIMDTYKACQINKMDIEDPVDKTTCFTRPEIVRDVNEYKEAPF